MKPLHIASAFNRRQMLLAAAGLTLGANQRTWAGTDASPAQKPRPARDETVAARFESRVHQARIPGASASLVRPGRPPLLLASGFASLPFRAKVSAATLFHVGSVGKHVTAVLLMRLAERGRIGLDDPVGKLSSAVPSQWKKVPVATMIAHTSGIPDYGGGINWDRPFGRSDFLADAADRPLLFAPGTAWSYCNAAYTLLGYVIEDVTGSSYADNVARLFSEAGLKDSRVDDGSAVIVNRSEAYEHVGEGWRHATAMSSDISSVAAGGILFSARDVPAWEAALSGDGLLSPSAGSIMVRPFQFQSGRPSHYNMGWNIDSLPGGGTFLWHSGSVSGFSSFHYRNEAVGLAAMFLFNSETDEGAAIGLELIEAFAPNSTPLSLLPIADDAPHLAAEVLAIVTRAGPWDQQRFASELQIAIQAVGDDAIDIFDPTLLPVLAFELVQVTGGDVVRRRYRASGRSKVQHVIVDYARDGVISAIRVL